VLYDAGADVGLALKCRVVAAQPLVSSSPAAVKAQIVDKVFGSYRVLFGSRVSSLVNNTKD